MHKDYKDTVALLLDIIPAIFKYPCFAMKGGTAINLFCRNMPRLSVDIDLVFIDPETPNREEALVAIEINLGDIAAELRKRLNVKIQKTASGSPHNTKLFISRGSTRVKVEVNHVFRGSVYPTVEGKLTPSAEELFEREVVTTMLDVDELYASKLVAALDRQHPRDLFDVMLMHQHGGITLRMRRAFVAYLAGHNRPLHELLPPQRQNITNTYNNEFIGMTAQPVSLEDLVETREKLFTELPASLDNAERMFLLSLHRLEPDWKILRIPGLEALPAIKWKLMNLRILKEKNLHKFNKMLSALEEKLASA